MQHNEVPPPHPQQTSKGQSGSGAQCDDLTIKLFPHCSLLIQTVHMCEPERCSGGRKAHPASRCCLRQLGSRPLLTLGFDFPERMSQVSVRGASVSSILSSQSSVSWSACTVKGDGIIFDADYHKGLWSSNIDNAS